MDAVLKLSHHLDYSPRKPRDELVERARKLCLTHVHNVGNTYYSSSYVFQGYVLKGPYDSRKEGWSCFSYIHNACYAINNHMKEMDFAAIAFDGRQAHVKPYIDFLLSPKESPYRSFLGDYEIVKDEEGNYRGVIFGEWIKDLTEGPLRVGGTLHTFRAMLVALRAVDEWPDNVRFWVHLVSLGIDKYKALCLFSFYHMDTLGKIAKCHTSGGHWVFNRSDYKRLRDGTIDHAGSSFTDKHGNKNYSINAYSAIDMVELKFQPKPQVDKVFENEI